jgi:hypothetical protein
MATANMLKFQRKKLSMATANMLSNTYNPCDTTLHFLKSLHIQENEDGCNFLKKHILINALECEH